MNPVLIDATCSEDIRREQLYQGYLFVYSPRPSALALCEFARSMLREAFHPYDPRTAQFELPVERFAAILAEVKPRFIHHPQSKTYVQGMLKELGCDLTKTYFDVPRLRSMAHGDYLKAGIAYAFHPHRDTWYSAPFCQLNWWMPIFELAPDNAMAFHPRYWSQPVKNNSDIYNYYEWNRRHRATAAQHIREDTREQPRAQEPIELDPQIRLLPPVGGVIIFSAAQMHSTVPNTSGVTRFSIDFRTVHRDDVVARRGAANVDSACTGTTLGDYLRGTDFAHLPAELILEYDPTAPLSGDLVYRPQHLEQGTSGG